ncbi:MAG: hypothetical protein OEY10_00155 [Nitrosopumilus sp.]|nr:hypothetical protein [Nitrosopumilus sp.]
MSKRIKELKDKIENLELRVNATAPGTPLRYSVKLINEMREAQMELDAWTDQPCKDDE